MIATDNTVMSLSDAGGFKTHREGRKQNRGRQVADNQAHAVAKFIRVPPRKARLVIDEVRGKYANDALAFLNFIPNRAARYISKVLASAIANAANNHGLNPDNLKLVEARVDEGPRMKRVQPRAQGRAYRILKRMSHITIIVEEVQPRPRKTKVKNRSQIHAVRSSEVSSMVRDQKRKTDELPFVSESVEDASTQIEGVQYNFHFTPWRSMPESKIREEVVMETVVATNREVELRFGYRSNFQCYEVTALWGKPRHLYFLGDIYHDLYTLHWQTPANTMEFLYRSKMFLPHLDEVIGAVKQTTPKKSFEDGVYIITDRQEVIRIFTLNEFREADNNTIRAKAISLKQVRALRIATLACDLYYETSTRVPEVGILSHVGHEDNETLKVIQWGKTVAEWVALTQKTELKSGNIQWLVEEGLNLYKRLDAVSHKP